MNRRQFMAVGASSLAALSVGNFAFAAEKPTFTNRLERYKQYNRILDEYPAVHKEISELTYNTVFEHFNIKPFPYEEYSNFLTKYSPQYYLCRDVATELAIYGDTFIIATPPQRIAKEYMYRVETVKGVVLEYQYSKTGSPDYAAIANCKVENAHTYPSKAIRFKPEEIVHLRYSVFPFHKLSEKEKATFFHEDRWENKYGHRAVYYPYGCSMLEPIRLGLSNKLNPNDVEEFRKTFLHGMSYLRRQPFGRT